MVAKMCIYIYIFTVNFSLFLSLKKKVDDAFGLTC